MLTTVRTEFAFDASQRRLLSILTRAASNSVNIAAFTFERRRKRSRKLRCRVVVGPPESNSDLQNCTFREILRDEGARHRRRHPIVQLYRVQVVSGTPGGIARTLRSLTNADICVLGEYYGEPAPDEVISVYIRVSKCDIDEAPSVLSAAFST